MERYGYSQENFLTWILQFDVVEFGETTQIFERPKDKIRGLRIISPGGLGKTCSERKKCARLDERNREG